MPMIIMLWFGAIFLITFFLVDRIITNYYLKKHQKEWNLIKWGLKELKPNITEAELMDYYCIYLDEIKSYFPRF